ncbi:MAG: aminopeptidase N, partial [Gammaproteobacteria bacterium]|nr:aminopeptidase N [Gammaproteobacteria bacterium]
MLRDAPNTIYLKDYLPPEFLIDKVDLLFDLGESVVRVKSRLAIRRNPSSDQSNAPLYLHGEQLEPVSLLLDGVPASPESYEITSEGLTIPDVPDSFVLESEVLIKPAENTALEGLYQSGEMLCTQCEAEGFRRITWYIDRPDVMSRFSTTITAGQEQFPVLLSNGNPVMEKEGGDGRRTVTWVDPFPKPSYLFALVAGKLSLVEDQYTTGSGRAIALRIYVESENIDKCEHAMKSLKKAMAWDEQHYGREYDLDIYMIV